MITLVLAAEINTAVVLPLLLFVFIRQQILLDTLRPGRQKEMSVIPTKT